MISAHRYQEFCSSFREMIPHVEAVSFDVFDTLFVRILHEPEALFDLLGNQLGVDDFRRLRGQAQSQGFHRMHQEGRGEIRLADIYDHVPAALAALADGGLREQALELDVLRVNPEVAALFHEARSRGKKVAWTSDMYLPESFFHALAERHGLQPDQYLVSSACNRTKRDDGSLFDLLAERLECDPANILHVGDNPLGDVQRAREKGLKVIHYLPPEFPKADSTLSPAASLGLGLSRYAAYQPAADAWWQLGWQFGGPIMRSFLDWVCGQASRDGVDRIVFVARDGFLLHELYLKSGNAGIESVYLRGSRVSFSLAALSDENFPAYVSFLMSGSDGITLSDLFTRIGVDLPDEAVLLDVGLKCSTCISTGNFSQIERFLCAMRPSILRVAREVRKGLHRYLLDLGLQEGMRVAFVDVGWSGTTQKAFIEAVRDMLPLDVVGYYLGLSAPVRDLERSKKIRMRVFSESAGLTSKEAEELYRNRAVVELFFSAPHSTTIGYRPQSIGNAFFVEDKERGVDYSIGSVVDMINTGIRDYIREAVAISHIHESSDSSMALHNLMQLACAPGVQQAHLVGQLYNWDAWASSVANHTYFVDAKDISRKSGRLSLWPAGFSSLEKSLVGASNSSPDHKKVS